MIRLAAAAALVGGGTSLLLSTVVAWRRWRAPPLPPVPAGPPPATTVLLPVRDEEHNVGDCLRHLLALAGGPRILVIDDGSRDRTAAIAREILAAAPHRGSLISAGELPPGWRGKVHALARGAEASSGGAAAAPWLLLTDADTRLEPDALLRAHAACARHGLDSVSLAGRQRARGPGENLLVPGVFRLLDAWLGPWPAARDGGPAVAAGQFVLVRRDRLQAAGGFAAIREATIDDVALVEALRRHGGRTGFWRAPDLVSARMYEGWSEAHRGWRRNLAAIFGGRPAATAWTLFLTLASSLSLVACLIAGAPALGWAVWVCGALGSALTRLTGGQNAAWSLLHPADELAVAWTLGRGLIDRHRRRLTDWKGRAIRL